MTRLITSVTISLELAESLHWLLRTARIEHSIHSLLCEHLGESPLRILARRVEHASNTNRLIDPAYTSALPRFPLPTTQELLRCAAKIDASQRAQRRQLRTNLRLNRYPKPVPKTHRQRAPHSY